MAFVVYECHFLCIFEPYKYLPTMTKTELAKEIIEKYIAIALTKNTQFSKRFLATVLQSENPDKFKDVEEARMWIRRALNADGNEHRSEAKEELARRFALIPSSIHDTVTSEPFIIPTSVKNTLWMADIHGRFYDRKAFEIAIESGIKAGCDSVVILGDFLDFYQHSKFDKNPSISIIFEEQEWGQDILKLLQDTFGYVVLKAGNHDARRENHIQRLSATMPELMGMASYSDYLFFDGCKVQFVEDYRHLRYGKLNGIHGHEYYGGGGIHAAYNRFNNALDNLISAHSHIGQSVIRTGINGEVYGSWSIACLCDLHPRYASHNKWTNGFARTTKDKSGDFEVENRIIMGNKTFSV
jgi:predicted phosphodiesterase